MKRSNKIMMRFPAFVLCAGILVCTFAQGQNEWKKDLDENGTIVKMTLVNPPTALQIEKEIVFLVDKLGKPTGDTIRFKSGFSRLLTQDETNNYWQNFHGSTVVWNYWLSQGMLVTIASGQIPKDWFGNDTRLIDVTNAEIIGKLGSSATPGEYLLTVDRACCGPIPFTMGGVRQLQQLKR